MTVGSRRAALACASFVAGCAMRASAPATSASASAPSSAYPSSAGGASAPSGEGSGVWRAPSSVNIAPASVSQEPFRAGVIQSVPSATYGLRPPADGDEAIAHWEIEIQRYQAALAAGVSACRDICSAAGNVCTAAREICLLTGDSAVGNARDVRCTRARAACSDAGRRRDGACPACPDPR